MLKIIIFSSLLGMNLVRAGEDKLDQADKSLSSDSLQMDDIAVGDLDSPSTRLRQRRDKLEERNKLMIKKRAKDIHIKQEIVSDGCNPSPYVSGCETSFGKKLNSLNEDKAQAVQMAPASPQSVPVAPTPTTKTSEDSLQERGKLEEKLSPSERLRQRREKLEKRNSVTDGCDASPYSQSCTKGPGKGIGIRLNEKKEIALTNKLKDAFGKSVTDINETKVKQVDERRDFGPSPYEKFTGHNDYQQPVKQAAPVTPKPIPVAPIPTKELKSEDN